MRTVHLLILLLFVLLAANQLATAAESDLAASFSTEEKQILNTEGTPLVLAFEPPRHFFAGKILLVPGINDATRFGSQLPMLQKRLSEKGYACWLLLRDDRGHANLPAGVQAALDNMRQYTAPKHLKIADAVAPVAPLAVVLEGDASHLLFTLGKNASVQQWLLINAPLPVEQALSVIAPVLDVMQQSASRELTLSFHKRAQNWGGDTYRSRMWPYKASSTGSEWLTHLITGTLRRQYPEAIAP